MEQMEIQSQQMLLPAQSLVCIDDSIAPVGKAGKMSRGRDDWKQQPCLAH